MRKIIGKPRIFSIGLAFLVLPLSANIWAQSGEENPIPPRAALHAQTTYIWQQKPGFSAAYSGPNSLSPLKEEAYSFTVTADIGLRLWDGAQVHYNPEGAQGVPFSNLLGAGGISNGELARGSSTTLNTYRARFFIQQRIGVGDDKETIEADFNEIGGSFATKRWTFTLGNFSLLDYFDANPYAKDPRKQFTNWSFLTHGAWDYAADSRGYTIGALVEYREPRWSVRLGRAMLPVESNGLPLDDALAHRHGDQFEIESKLPITLPGGPMRGRLLYFRNTMNAGNFAEATALGGTPDVGLVRREQTKTGWGFTLEAPFSDDSGAFIRVSRNSGDIETYAFAEIDSQLAIGAQFTGASWNRGMDRWGVAYAVNGLSDSHQSYLAAGGVGFFLGDGKLNYDTEKVLEAYYSFALPAWNTKHAKLQSAITFGLQHISNPGYNRDRGPVKTYTFRWHSEF